MKYKIYGLWRLVLVFACAGLVHADDPTSKYLRLSRLASSLPASRTGVAVQVEVWDQATGGTMIFSEAHTVDTDAGSNISNDTGLGDLLLGRPGGLVTANFPAGSSRYLDVTQDGVSVLTARVPLYASAFSIAGPGEVTGNLALVDSTPTAGNILKGGALFLHNFGMNNTFRGQNAGNLTMTGGGNTASGANALQNNTTGYFNTATGAAALGNTTTGSQNTAIGYFADVAVDNLTNATAIGAGARVDASNKIRYRGRPQTSWSV